MSAHRPSVFPRRESSSHQNPIHFHVLPVRRFCKLPCWYRRRRCLGSFSTSCILPNLHLDDTNSDRRNLRVLPASVPEPHVESGFFALAQCAAAEVARIPFHSAHCTGALSSTAK